MLWPVDNFIESCISRCHCPGHHAGRGGGGKRVIKCRLVGFYGKFAYI